MTYPIPKALLDLPGIPEGPEEAMDFLIGSYSHREWTPATLQSLAAEILSAFRMRALAGLMEDVEWDVEISVSRTGMVVDLMPTVLRGCEIELEEDGYGNLICTHAATGAKLVAADYICARAAVAARILAGDPDWQLVS